MKKEQDNDIKKYKKPHAKHEAQLLSYLKKIENGKANNRTTKG